SARNAPSASAASANASLLRIDAAAATTNSESQGQPRCRRAAIAAQHAASVKNNVATVSSAPRRTQSELTPGATSSHAPSSQASSGPVPSTLAVAYNADAE